MRWTPLFMLCLLPSPLALAVAAAPPASQVRDGYRLAELPSAPALRKWETGRQTRDGGCGRLPPLPALQAGELEVMPLVHDRFFNKFFQGGGRLYRLVTQQQGVPHAIIIRSGRWSLPALAARLAREPGALRREGNAYLLRMPLLLGSGTSLVVNQGESLRLSRERGAFIVSLGDLHVRKARLEAWSEGRGGPAAADTAAFRPFVLGWSGSGTFIGNSTVAGLGFAENLARGLGFAVGPVGLADYVLPAPPRVVVHDSHFEGLHEGVQAAAVPELRLCRNQFEASRQYALHLEQGSGGWVVGNRLTATDGPYAIYASGVSAVRLVANEVVENHRSGIAISDSRDIVLAENQVRQNYDGLFLERVDDVLMTDNYLLDNQRHGVSLSQVGRVRLQGDHIGPNRGVGLLARTAAADPGGKRAGSAAAASPASPASATSATSLASTAPAAVPGQRQADAPAVNDGASMPAPIVKVSAAPGPGAAPAGENGSARDEPGDGARAAPVAAMRIHLQPSSPRLELVNVALEGNHSSAMEIQRPYTVLMHRVDVLYPGVRRRPVFRGVLNAFESDVLDALPHSKTLQVAPVSGKH